jgi:hypothetical protein
MVYFGEELVTLRYVVGIFSHGNLSLFWEFLKWLANIFQPMTTGKGVAGINLKSEDRRAEWMT